MSTLSEHAQYLEEYNRSGLVELESIEVKDYQGQSPATMVLLSDIRLLFEKAKEKIIELKKETGT